MARTMCCSTTLFRVSGAVIAAVLGLAGSAGAQSQLGACCYVNANGSPTCIANAASTQCQSLGGVFYSGQACTAAGCTTTGACCVNATCATITAAQCAQAHGNFVAAGTCNGSVNPCPLQGACCNQATGVCVQEAQSSCVDANGLPLFWIANGSCSPNPCAGNPTGACCDVGGGCFQTTKANCNGTWTAGGSCVGTTVLCAPSGACCDPLTGLCQIVFAANCPTSAQFFPNTSCKPLPCTPTGSCCTTQGCILTLASDCQALNGVFVGTTSCSPNPCPGPRGACCTASLTAVGNNCVLTTQGNCPTGSLFLPNTTCSPNPCPSTETGACCGPNGCVVVAKGQCASSLLYIPGQPCVPNPCPPVGACCTAAAGCVQTLQANCPGQFYLNKPCTPDPCQQTGACCVPGATCVVTVPTQCSGTWYPNFACSPNPCVTGACCNKVTGACFVTSPARCDAAGLVYLGTGTPCVATTCPRVVGACCYPGTVACVITTQAQCTGTWNPNTTCATHPCYKADFNGDGTLSVQDIFDFLSSWFCKCP